MIRSKEAIINLLEWFEKFSDDVYYQKNITKLKNLIDINIRKDLVVQNSDLQKYRQKMYIIYDEKQKVIIDLSLSLKQIEFMVFKAPYVSFLYFYKNYQLNYITRKSKKANMLAGWKKVLLSEYAKEK